MRDLTYNPLRSREVTVTRRFLEAPAAVHAAIDAWASDSGWVPVREAESGLVYEGDASGFFGKLPFNVFRDFQVSVSLFTDEDGVAAVFTVAVIGQLPGIEAELERAGETFADGVFSYVEQFRGTAADEGGPNRLTRRSCRGSVSRFLKVSQGVLVIGLVPVTGLVYLIGRSGIAAMLTWLWLCLLVISAMFIRYRIYGMRMWIFPFCIGILLLGLLPATLVFALT